jgi:hypothetical protein
MNVFTRRETYCHVVLSSFSSLFLIEYMFTSVTDYLSTQAGFVDIEAFRMRD